MNIDPPGRTTANEFLPAYAKNAPAGMTPKGIHIPDHSHKMAKGLSKMAKLGNVPRLKRSLLRRLSLPKTRKKRFF